MVKGSIVMPCTGGNGVVLRSVGLGNNLSRAGTPPRPTGYLAEELKGAFASTKVWEMEDSISGDYSHKAHRREIKPLGNHLRPDEDIRPVSKEFVQDALMGIFPPGYIPVPAQ